MNQENIGKFIKKLRQESHLTQKQFADKYGVTFQAVSKWENGKNIPDISVLRQICKDHGISMEEILGDKPTHKSKKPFIIVGAIIFLIILFTCLFFFLENKSSDFQFKKISTTCSSFKITGSAAYNKDKSSLYISNIEFCGKNENIEYKELTYTLYENYEKGKSKISGGNQEQNLTLVNFLKKIKINVDHYEQLCKSFTHSNLSIEIKAIDYENKETLFKIPLLLEKNCEV
ncbi:MAG: helix-turn-helix transcriptional regulator [Bacilli bacterium]|nr:helix-turn-helix transcriptional regulator [Bacilli bacterium]